jgi:tetratricopeptide (TPR) repeat protein/CHAT domain-containing protein
MKKLVLLAFIPLFVAFPLVAQDAEFYFERGLECLNAGNFNQAIEDFTEAIRLKPDYFDPYKFRGDVYYYSREYDRAIEDYNNAINLNPNDVRPWNNRGLAYSGKGELDRAIEDFNKVIVLDEKYANAWINRGSAYANKGEIDQAIEDYTQAIELDKSNASTWISRGITYYFKGEMDRAIEDYTKAIELDKSNVSTWISRGIIYKNKGELDKAIEDYDKAIDLDPNYYEAWYCRGIAYADKGELDKAIEDYNKTIEINPNNYEVWYYRGIAYANKGELDQAIRDYTNAIDLDPSYAATWRNRGNAYSDKGELDQAIQDYTKAIDLDPSYAGVWNNRGAEYYSKGELDRAIEDFTKAIDLDPSYAGVWNNRGYAYYYKEELDRAIQDYTKAIDLDPSYAVAWNNRGIAYFGKGELDRAIEDFSKTITLNPNNITAWNGRGLAYKAKGDLDHAIEDFSKAIAIDQDLAKIWNNRGLAYIDKGELDRAISDFSKAIALDPNDAYVRSNRGIAYMDKGELEQAIDDYNEAILLNSNYDKAWINRGNAYRAKRELDRAIEDYSKAIALNPNDANSWNNRGLVYEEKNELGLAIQDYRQSIEVADKSGNILDIFFWSWESVGGIYKFHPFLGDIINTTNAQFPNFPCEALSRSISKAEKARSSLGTRGAQIMTGLLYQYYAGVDFEVVFGSAEQAFAYSESLRSRGFLEQMGTEAALKLPGVQEADAQNIRRLIRDIDALRDLLSRLDPQMDATRYADAGIALSRAEAELAALDAAIARDVPRYAEIRNPATATLAQAMSLCENNRAILEYVIWDDSVEFKAPSYSGGKSLYPDRPSINSYCLVITSEGITAVRLDPEFDYASTINELRRKIFSLRLNGQPLFNEDAFETERNNLYNALIKPVVEHIPNGITELMIVPDSTLGHLPFDLLREDNNSPDLGQRFRISLSPSVSVSVLASETRVTQNLPIMAFGGALYSNDKISADRGQRLLVMNEEELDKSPVWHDIPGTEIEVKNLEKIIASSESIRIFLGRQVSEERIKALSTEGELAIYPILHFACHGYFNEKDPGRSGIVLSEVSGFLNNGEDGYLTIPEIVLLNMKARIVLLSACETGLGVVRRGDGMVGMARAFLVSGAENVGVSLWSISDEATTEFMTALYGKVLNEGKSFKEAYYLVKNGFRSNERWSHPYYWAAFTMYE